MYSITSKIHFHTYTTIYHNALDTYNEILPDPQVKLLMSNVLQISKKINRIKVTTKIIFVDILQISHWYYLLFAENIQVLSLLPTVKTTNLNIVETDSQSKN